MQLFFSIIPNHPHRNTKYQTLSALSLPKWYWTKQTKWNIRNAITHISLKDSQYKTESDPFIFYSILTNIVILFGTATIKLWDITGFLFIPVIGFLCRVSDMTFCVVIWNLITLPEMEILCMIRFWWPLLTFLFQDCRSKAIWISKRNCAVDGFFISRCRGFLLLLKDRLSS